MSLASLRSKRPFPMMKAAFIACAIATLVAVGFAATTLIAAIIHLGLLFLVAFSGGS
jgi:hypothetical protein